MWRILRSNYFFVAVCLFLAILAFGRLPLAFFQQDEWAIIGTFLYFDKTALSWFERLFTYGQGTHMIPLSGLLSIFEYKLFGLNFSLYAYASVVLQLINSCLVAYLAFLFFKKKIPAFLAGFIFLIDFIPSQGITWIATTSSTVGSILFALISLILLTKFTLYKSKKIYLFLSLVFLFASLLFKESSIFLFAFFPLFLLIFSNNKSRKTLFLYLTGIFLTGALYIVPRFLLMLLNSSSKLSLSEGLAYPSFPVYIYRVITLPFKIIAQSIIPVNQIIAVAEKLTSYGYPNLSQLGISNIYIAQNMGLDNLSYIISIAIILICLFLYKKALKANISVCANLILVSLTFIALSSLPLIFVPGNAGYFSLFDGRYLYIGSIFKSILLVNISLLLYTFLKNRKAIFISLIIFYSLFTLLNILAIRNSLEREVAQGDMRKSILNQIISAYPNPPTEVVFYVESDTAHYGLPIEERIMPFFSGFGQTLLVWYEGHGQDFPACFFKDKYLYAIIEQGYKECEGRGYGYFRKFDSLREAVGQYGIDPNNIISFRYISGEDKLEDISIETRNKLIQ